MLCVLRWYYKYSGILEVTIKKKDENEKIKIHL